MSTYTSSSTLIEVEGGVFFDVAHSWIEDRIRITIGDDSVFLTPESALDIVIAIVGSVQRIT